MNLILTIVKKDARRLRWQLVLLGLVMTMKFGVGFWLVLGQGRGELGWQAGSRIGLVLMVAEGVLAYLLAGALVLGDSVAGAHEFWQTRPISGRRLLAAKLIGAGVFLGLPPLVLGLPWWLTNGFGVGEILRATALAWAWRVVLVAAAFFVASLVNTTSRFVMWSVVGVAALGSQSAVWSVVLSEGRTIGSVGVGLALAGLIVAVAVAVVPGRYRSGIAAGWRVCGALAIFGSAAGTGLWMAVGQGTFGNYAWAESRPERVRDVKLTWLEAVRGEFRRRDGTVSLESRLGVVGVPEGLETAIGSVQSAWTWSGGERSPGHIWSYGLDGRPELVRELLLVAPWNKDEETAQWFARKNARREERSKADQRPIPHRWPEGAGLAGSVAAYVAPAVAERIARAQPAYEIKANLRFYRPVKWGEAPLRPGGWQTGEDHGFRIKRLSAGPMDAQLTVIESRPMWSMEYFAALAQRHRKRSSYYAVNREADRLAGAAGAENGINSNAAWIGGVALSIATMTVQAEWVMRGEQRVVKDPNWLEKTQLVWVGWDEVARINRTVRTEKFTVTE